MTRKQFFLPVRIIYTSFLMIAPNPPSTGEVQLGREEVVGASPWKGRGNREGIGDMQGKAGRALDGPGVYCRVAGCGECN